MLPFNVFAIDGASLGLSYLISAMPIAHGKAVFFKANPIKILNPDSYLTSSDFTNCLGPHLVS